MSIINENEEFAEAWEEAKREAFDLLEFEAIRRARQGVREPHFYQDQIVGHVNKFSDTLLIFLMKAGQPGRFRDNVSHEHSGSVGQEHSGGLDVAHSGKVDNRVVFEFHRPGGAVEYRHQVGDDPPDDEGEEE